MFSKRMALRTRAMPMYPKRSGSSRKRRAPRTVAVTGSMDAVMEALPGVVRFNPFV